MHPSPSHPPHAHSRVQVVNSFYELVSTPFRDGVNALCWRRSLEGDYKEVLEHLTPSAEAIATLDEATLSALPLSTAGRTAADTMLEDQRRLASLGVAPVLNCIQAYPRDEEPGPVATDVYSFHADSATVETDTYLCTYSGAASEGLSNEEAQRKMDVPEIRAELLKIFGGEDDGEFLEFLKENCYDLHYAALAGARPFSFGVGNMWRIAVDYPGSPVPPCVHRAPEILPGQPPRLLLIS